MPSVLEAFGAATREWFAGAFRAPTPAQEGAWAAIAKGSTRSSSPRRAPARRSRRSSGRSTGSPPARGHAPRHPRPLHLAAQGARRRRRAQPAQPARRRDADRQAARAGAAADHASASAPATRASPTGGRSRSDPPDILITTPESLFLMLTSAARETLVDVDTVIVDEVHAVAATKRGSHLALSLERLDAMLERPAQRIGLSATVRPVEEVARFLGGRSPVTIVAPKAQKTFDLTVVVPVEDMSDPTSAAVARAGTASRTRARPRRTCSTPTTRCRSAPARCGRTSSPRSPTSCSSTARRSCSRTPAGRPSG